LASDTEIRRTAGLASILDWFKFLTPCLQRLKYISGHIVVKWPTVTLATYTEAFARPFQQISAQCPAEFKCRFNESIHFHFPDSRCERIPDLVPARRTDAAEVEHLVILEYAAIQTAPSLSDKASMWFQEPAVQDITCRQRRRNTPTVSYDQFYAIVQPSAQGPSIFQDHTFQHEITSVMLNIYTRAGYDSYRVAPFMRPCIVAHSYKMLTGQQDITPGTQALQQRLEKATYALARETRRTVRKDVFDTAFSASNPLDLRCETLPVDLVLAVRQDAYRRYWRWSAKHWPAAVSSPNIITLI
jgi:hypothetical protein